MEDASLDAEMLSVREDGETDRYSPEERYSPVPDSPHDMPLLDGDESVDLADQSAAALLPEVHQEPRTRSIDRGRRHSTETGDTSSLVRVDTNVTNETPDPRGAAPAYFEVVDLSDEVAQTAPVPTSSASPPPPTSSSLTAASTASNRSSNRRSFRNLFGFSGNRSSPLAPPPGLPLTSEQSRERADTLSLTSTPSRPSTSHHNLGHRPSQSSSSLFSVANPLNRKKSTATLNSNHLTSPSLISLASISAPLTHTVVRTEFTYPKTGPTPEQLKLISSREAFSRFGRPYGEDAIAFAASTQDLNPPPEFESTESAVGRSSRFRSQSRATADAPNNTEPAGRSSESSGESSSSNRSSALETPEIRIHESSRPASIALDTPATVNLSSPVQGEVDDLKVTEESKSEISIMDVTDSSPVESLRKDTVVSLELQSSHLDQLPETSTKDIIISSPSTYMTENIALPSHVSASVPTSSKPPPTSFRNPSAPSANTPSIRSESRASSFRSFATARESVNEFGAMGDSGSGSETPTMSDSEYYSEQETEMGDDGSRPATPTTPTTPGFLNGHNAHHALEGTDTTVHATA